MATNNVDKCAGWICDTVGQTCSQGSGYRCVDRKTSNCTPKDGKGCWDSDNTVPVVSTCGGWMCGTIGQKCTVGPGFTCLNKPAGGKCDPATSGTKGCWVPDPVKKCVGDACSYLGQVCNGDGGVVKKCVKKSVGTCDLTTSKGCWVKQDTNDDPVGPLSPATDPDDPKDNPSTNTDPGKKDDDGGGKNTVGKNGNDNTTMYIVFGVLLAALFLVAVMGKKHLKNNRNVNV